MVECNEKEGTVILINKKSKIEQDVAERKLVKLQKEQENRSKNYGASGFKSKPNYVGVNSKPIPLPDSIYSNIQKPYILIKKYGEQIIFVKSKLPDQLYIVDTHPQSGNIPLTIISKCIEKLPSNEKIIFAIKSGEFTDTQSKKKEIKRVLREMTVSKNRYEVRKFDLFKDKNTKWISVNDFVNIAIEKED